MTLVYVGPDPLINLVLNFFGKGEDGDNVSIVGMIEHNFGLLKPNTGLLFDAIVNPNNLSQPGATPDLQSPHR